MVNDYMTDTSSNCTAATGAFNGIMGSSNYKDDNTPSRWEFASLSLPSMGVPSAPPKPIIKNKSNKMEVELCLCSKALWS